MKTHVVAAAICIGLGGLALRDRIASAPPARTPELTVYAMLDAARNGDVNGWLAVYTGNLAASFQAAARERGAPAFSDWLKSTDASLKGVALQPAEKLGDGSVRVQVEYVFADRNEKQAVYLRLVDNAWRIERLDSAARVPTLVPYGTTVN
jgi:hypothetical protein